MITRSLITQGAVNHNEIWRLPGRRDLTCGSDADQQVATAGEKFLRNEYSERCTYRATNNTDNLCANCECIEFGVITRPVVRWVCLTGSLKTADNVAVRVQDADWRGRSGRPSPFWRRASRKSAEGAKTDLAAGFLFLSNGGITETSCAGTLKHNAIVIGWNFDKLL